MPGLAWTQAHVFAAQRRYAEADAALAQGRPGEARDVSRALAIATMQVDRGEWDRAKQTLAEAQAWGVAAVGSERAGLALAGLGILDGTNPGESVVQDLRRRLEARAALAAVDRGQWLSDTLFATHLAVRAGRASDAERALADIGGAFRLADYPIPANLEAVGKAGLAIGRSQGAEALALLRPFLDDDGLFLGHELARQAHAAAGDFAAAQAEAEWLAKRRGRAYAEVNIPQAMPIDIALSRLAVLEAAHHAIQREDKASARRLLDDAASRWPAFETVPAFRERLRVLRSSL